MKNDATTYKLGDYGIRVYKNNNNHWECKLCDEKNLKVFITIKYITWGSLCRKCSKKYGLDINDQKRKNGIALMKMKELL